MQKNSKLKIKKENILFSISIIYLLILGILLTYNYDIKNNYTLLFESDTARVISDQISINANHYRASVHPLFIILTQPIVFVLSGLFLNKIISVIVLSTIISSLTVTYLYKTLNLVNKNEKISFILALIYLFSFSNIVYTAGIETYNFSAFTLVLLWYFCIKKSKDTYNRTSYIILVLLGILSAAFTITNFMIFIIIIVLLLIDKKINLKKATIIMVVTIISIIGLNTIQKVVWHSTPYILNQKSKKEEIHYITREVSIKNIKNILKADYINSLISGKISITINDSDKYNGGNFELQQTKDSIFYLSLVIVFYLSLIILLLKKSKNILLNIGLITALGFNSGMHIFYGNDAPFLYSLHFLYLIILLYGTNYSNIKSNKKEKITYLFLSLFLITEIIKNNISFIKIINYSHKILEGNYFIKRLGIPLTIILEICAILFVFLIIITIIKLIKRIKNSKVKEQKALSIGYIVLLVIITVSMFIGIESLIVNDVLSNKFKLSPNKQELVINKENYLTESFKNHYKKEFQELTIYREELVELQSNYDIATIKLDEIGDYYFFGLGNRKKLMYVPGKIIDVETREILYKFNEKESMILPNIYSVIISTEDNKYIKIYEDSDGVHFNLSGKDEIIAGTDMKIKLYEFNNQQYQNIKKVLYSEILFNIKDSAIYPNIIVYEKPWYRDAAIACMVLKQTDNTDLIKSWVENIDDIYDEQSGMKEADNLGELLYILSTQEEQNEDLIDRIEEEAERIAQENEKGYYIEGKTDYGDMYLYQNLWYKLGIESVGRKFNFDLSNIEEDPYAKLTWWSDYNIKYQKSESPNERYPYLTIAAVHKLKSGQLILRDRIYPLSWEREGGAAKYENYTDLLPNYSVIRTSPPHTWTAAELLLLLMDETGDFELK